jgi:predicted RNA binding protein YcfA (HicA-like mRNA interferase family)
MPDKLKNLSGVQLIKIMELFSFQISSQKGSHVKLVRAGTYSKQCLIIPKHKELDKGTIKAIYNQILHYISEDELHPYFYSK